MKSGRRLTIGVRDITSVTLVDALPRIVGREQGLQRADVLRGRFAVEQFGTGHVFVASNSPPFVLVRTAHEFLFVNYPEPARTRDLYRALPQHRPGQRPRE